MSERQTRAFEFEGNWREYAPIAFTNLLLTIVTLGIYRFWATTRTRHYLWSRTRFLDEPLEWAGTAMELFIGFLLVLALFGLPFLFLQFGMQALIFQGYREVAYGLAFLAVMLIYFLTGVARFRALRYRLSRTYWHGIRGGSNDKGWGYGWSYIWRNFVGSLALGLLIPWAMVSLWNDRWNKMSFGPYPFEAAALSGKVMKRFLLFYLLPVILLILIIAGAFLGAGLGLFGGSSEPTQPGVAMMFGTVMFVVLIYGAMGVVALAFYAKFFRVVVRGMSLSGLNFRFRARSKAWLMLILGDIGLVIVTLGIGAIFLSYRHWTFFITHLDATGDLDRAALTQSTTLAPGQGEGLADAFDIGAI